MKFTVNREVLLRPLQLVSGAVERRHSLPVLGNILLEVSEQSLRMTGTDLEVELVASVMLQSVQGSGSTTVPAKKLVDIVRSLPDGSELVFNAEGDRLILRSGRSRFTLSTLPANEFPNIEEWQFDIELQLQQKELRRLIDRTQFSMANQDVRYYLNGMLFETQDNILRTVATDGHRLSMAFLNLDGNYAHKQCIVPRKGVLELARLLDNDDAGITLQFGSNHTRAVLDGFIFTSKLVDGRFPEYQRVLPRGGDLVVEADRDSLRQALGRAAILSNEKFRGIRMNLQPGELKITANNPEQEEAEEVVEVSYQGSDLEMGFNASYIQDVTNALDGNTVRIVLSDANSSALIDDPQQEGALYVVMPMRL